MFKWLYKLFFVPAAYHCKPIMREHEWRSSHNIFPVCKHCGEKCWWAFGYSLRSGTFLGPDYEAQSLMTKEQKDKAHYIGY